MFRHNWRHIFALAFACLFKLPKLNTPEYTEMFQKMSTCRSNSSRREEACAIAIAIAIASNLSNDRNNSVSLSQTQEEVASSQSAASGISYQTVIWNRDAQTAVNVEGEYASVPSAR
jgi:ADP-ribosylglycohydrolase